MKRGRARVVVLMMCDALTMTLSWLAVSVVYALFSGETPTAWFCLVRKSLLGSYLVLNVFARLYHGNPIYPGMAVPPISEFARLVTTSFGAGIIFFSYRYVSVINEADMSYVAMLSVCLNMFLAQSARNRARAMMMRFASRWFSIPVVLVGGESARRAFGRAVQNDAHSGITIAQGAEDVEEAVSAAKTHKIRHCISVQPFRVLRQSMGTLMSAFSVVVALPEGAMPLAARPVEFNGVGGIEFVNRSSFRLQRLVKSVLEFLLAVVACFVFAVPALAISLMIWLSDPNAPVVYRARRKGLRGADIEVLKFRTMVPDADRKLAEILSGNAELRKEWNERFKLDNDPRVTRIGSFLRKTSLDELPQLINVIRGDMALIGPRPIVEKEIAYYGEAYDEFSSVKPGVTGLWQVSGRSETDYVTRVALDSYYVRNWSVWMDLWIVRRTVGEVVSGRGAK